MRELSTREVFSRLEDAEAVENEVRMTFDLDRNLRTKSVQCSKIADKYGGTAVAVGVLHIQVADLVSNRVIFDLTEPLYNGEFKGEHTLKDCWLATETVSATVQAVNAFYLQYLAVVDRSTKQVLALHNAV